MDKQEQQARAKEASSQGARKKPYVKPAYVSEKIFETTALACAKRPGEGAACNASPSFS